MAGGLLRPRSNRYRHLLDWLLHVNRGRQVKLGLQNMQDMMTKLGPGFRDEHLKILHVAGTNGKGSVCWKLAKTLEDMGFKVGLFSSPHISSFRERVSVNGEPISEEEIEEILPIIVECCAQHDIPATFFELTTMMSLGHFVRQEVDYAVYEVGLGGRLDSTNIVNPLVSVITSISLDHTQILGETIEEIAREKGGIIKPGVPVVVGPNVPHAALEPMARSKGSTYVKAGDLPDELKKGETDYEDFNVENSAIALEALRQVLPSQAISTAKLWSLPPCRFQRFVLSSTGTIKELLDPGDITTDDVELVLDVAHNDDAFSKLFSKVRKAYPIQSHNVTTIMGLSSSKDVRSCVRHAIASSRNVYFVKAASERAMETKELVDATKEVGMEGKAEIVGEGSVAETIERAKNAARTGQLQGKSDREVVIICGSFFIMKEARNALQIPQAVDPEDLNERYKDKDVASQCK